MNGEHILQIKLTLVTALCSISICFIQVNISNIWVSPSVKQKDQRKQQEQELVQRGANWGDLSGVNSDKKMPRKLKIKLYMTIITTVLLYGAECWIAGEKEEQILEKTKMMILRRIKGVTLRDKGKSVDFRKELEVNNTKEKVRSQRNETTVAWTHAEIGRKQRSDSNC